MKDCHSCEATSAPFAVTILSRILAALPSSEGSACLDLIGFGWAGPDSDVPDRLTGLHDGRHPELMSSSVPTVTSTIEGIYLHVHSIHNRRHVIILYLIFNI